jgi:hypothetical protein
LISNPAGKAAVALWSSLVIVGGDSFHGPNNPPSPLEQIPYGCDHITKEDLITAKQLLPSVLQDPGIASKLKLLENKEGHRLLAYFIPIDYVMQGMIANTGGEWKLFEQHKTLGMITEYIFHPFAHLTVGHSHHAEMQTVQICIIAL